MSAISQGWATAVNTQLRKCTRRGTLTSSAMDPLHATIEEFAAEGFTPRCRMMIQERYGLAKDQVKKDVDAWYSSQSW